MPRQAGETTDEWQIPTHGSEEKYIWSTHSTKECDAGAEAHSSRNYAELPSLVINSGWRAVRGLWDKPRWAACLKPGRCWRKPGSFLCAQL